MWSSDRGKPKPRSSMDFGDMEISAIVSTAYSASWVFHSKCTFYSYSQFAYLNTSSESILCIASWLARVHVIVCDFQIFSGNDAC